MVVVVVVVAKMSFAGGFFVAPDFLTLLLLRSLRFLSMFGPELPQEGRETVYEFFIHLFYSPF